MIKKLDNLRKKYDLATLISAGVPLRTLLDMTVSIKDILNVNPNLLLDLLEEDVPIRKFYEIFSRVFCNISRNRIVHYQKRNIF